MQKNPLIETIDLEKEYRSDEGKTAALRGVTLQIDAAEFVAIMGPSGSGKSTLLHILGFLDLPTAGTYRLNGRAVSEYGEGEMARVRNSTIGFIFQAFNLLRRTTVIENVKLPLLYSEIDEARWDSLARVAIERVGLSHRSHHEPSQLSGGEQQRVAIARALVMSPEIIFADEPTGNLDTQSGKAVMKTLVDLNREGHTIVLITHESTTAQHAQRIIHMRDGRIEKEETPAHRRAVGDFAK